MNSGDLRYNITPEQYLGKFADNFLLHSDSSYVLPHHVFAGMSFWVILRFSVPNSYRQK